jgi:hypothetical protein
MRYTLQARNGAVVHQGDDLPALVGGVPGVVFLGARNFVLHDPRENIYRETEGWFVPARSEGDGKASSARSSSPAPLTSRPPAPKPARVITPGPTIRQADLFRMTQPEKK